MMTAIQALYREELDHGRAIRLWLYVVAALVFAMVLVGGATRLTESGLSITEWQPVTGTLPPLNQAQWQTEFQKYQAIPQYRQLNDGMSLTEFKTIYWWEWAHRIIGRVIGVAFFVPLVWFLWRGWIPARHRAGLWAILALGALQGALGWWMVASGLAGRVEVSQYRLATHLVLACLIYVALLWTAARWPNEELQPLFDRLSKTSQSMTVRAGAIALVVLLLAQIYLGALVAGLRAGHAYNTWPLIDGGLIPQASHLLLELRRGRLLERGRRLQRRQADQTWSRFDWRGSRCGGGRRAGGAGDLDAALSRGAVARAFASGRRDARADCCGYSCRTHTAAESDRSGLFDVRMANERIQPPSALAAGLYRKG